MTTGPASTLGRQRRRWRASAPELTILAVGALGGLLFAFVSPPFQVPDENVHLRRAYQIATGAPLERRADGSLGVELPASLEELIRLCLAGRPFLPLGLLPAGTLEAARRIPLAPARQVFVPLIELTPYTPVPYLPQAAGAAVGRWLELRPLWILYLARLCNLAACLALAWLAVRIAPFYKWTFTLLALTPMAMFLRSSASPDALTTAAPLLLVSAICALACGPRAAAVPAGPGGGDGGGEDGPAPGERALRGGPGAPARRERALPGEVDKAAASGDGAAERFLVAWLLIASAIVAGSKSGYFLLNLLVLAIPARRLGPRRRWAAVIGAVLLITVAGFANSSWAARSYFGHFQRAPSVQPYLQARGVAAHPLRFLGLVVADYAQHLTRYAVGFVGNFGWLDTPLPAAVLVAYAFLLLASAVTGGDPGVDVSRGQRLLIAAVLAAELLVVSTSQYLGWTPLGAHSIEGPQGRYYLPLAPAGALLLYNRRWAGRFGGVSAARLDAALASASVATTAIALVRIWTRYHGW